MKIPEAVRELVESGPLGHLTTLNSDGSPQVTVVWLGIEDDEFVIGHMGVWRKVRNIRRDPRVALSLLGAKTNAQGLREYLVIRGRARVTEGGAPALLQRLARVYLGPEAEFPRRLIAIVPDISRASRPNILKGSARGIRQRRRQSQLIIQFRPDSRRRASPLSHRATHWPWRLRRIGSGAPHGRCSLRAVKRSR